MTAVPALVIGGPGTNRDRDLALAEHDARQGNANLHPVGAASCDPVAKLSSMHTSHLLAIAQQPELDVVYTDEAAFLASVAAPGALPAHG